MPTLDGENILVVFFPLLSLFGWFCSLNDASFLQNMQDKHRFSGMVEDCCCDYETVDHLNEELLHPVLHELVKTPFFRYFKVSLLQIYNLGINFYLFVSRDKLYTK